MEYDAIFLPVSLSYQRISLNEVEKVGCVPAPVRFRSSKQKQKLCPVPLGTFIDTSEIQQYLTFVQHCDVNGWSQGYVYPYIVLYIAHTGAHAWTHAIVCA